MLFAFDNVLDVITLSSYFTVSLSPGVAMWEVQRCDRMWGKSASADSLNQSINAYIPLQPGSQRHMFISRWILTPKTPWLQRDRLSTVCQSLEKTPGWKRYPLVQIMSNLTWQKISSNRVLSCALCCTQLMFGSIFEYCSPVFLNSVAQLCRLQPSQSGSFHLVCADQTETQLRGRRRHGRHGHAAAAAEAEGATCWYELLFKWR